MNEKSKKTALTVTSIITACCLIAAVGLGVLSRFRAVSEVFYYIIAYIALITMMTDACIRKRRLARFFMVIIYSVCILAVTILIFLS